MEGILTQDVAPEKQLSDDMFDLGAEETNDSDAINPDDLIPGVEETPEETSKETPEEVPEETPKEQPDDNDSNTEQDEISQLLKELGVDNEESGDTIEEASDSINDAIDKVEDLNKDETISESNDEVLEKLYEDLLNAQASEKSLKVTNDILESKFTELQSKYDEIRLGGGDDFSDQDLYVINSQYEKVLNGDNSERFIKSLKTIYQKVTGESLDEALTNDELNNADSGIQYGSDSPLTIDKEKEFQETGTIEDIIG